MQVASKASHRREGKSPIPHPSLAGLIIVLFFTFSALCLFGGAANILRLAFPAGALLVSIFLYFKSPTLYIGFVWWLWFLSPLIRRLIDFQIGWQDPNVVLLAPFLATSVTLITFVQYLPKLHVLKGLPFLWSLVAVIYALLVGLIYYPPTAIVIPFLNWVTPIAFGFYLFINWRNYVAYCRVFQQTFLWGTIVMGAYGVWQFLTAPEWDKFWLVNSKALAFGKPAPLEMRVWSTMHSPGPFAVVMMAGLFLLLHNRKKVVLPAAILGYLTFLLSQVRAVWLGWAIGLFLLIISLKPHLKIRLFITLIVMALCIVPLVTLEPYSEVITARLESFSTLTSDGSYQDRTGGYDELFNYAVAQVLGKGLGYVIEIDSFGANDSGILTLFLTLGWFGTILYLSGLVLLLARTFQKNKTKSDPLFNVFRSISVGVVAQLGLGTAMLGVSGMVLWGFLGIALAGRQYSQSALSELTVPAVP